MAELRSVKIECKCGTYVVVDLKSSPTEELAFFRRRENDPLMCPNCGDDYDSAVSSALIELKSLYSKIAGLNKLSFLVRPVTPTQA